MELSFLITKEIKEAKMKKKTLLSQNFSKALISDDKLQDISYFGTKCLTTK